MVCIDASFVVNIDKSSQLEVLAMMRDKKNGNVNIVYCTFGNIKGIRKYVLASELFAFIEGFDSGFSICHSLQSIFDKTSELNIYLDSQSLCGLCISLARTAERRLQIDLSILFEAYERRDIDDINWIAGSANPADDLTKGDVRNGMPADNVSKNKFTPSAQSWIL